MSVITPNFVPREYKTLNLFLIVPDAERAIQYYNSAFGAELTLKLVDGAGAIARAELKIEDTIIILSEDQKATAGNGVVFQLYSADVEGTFENAVRAGGKIVSPIEKKFYGDRAGKLEDPFGFQWIIATHFEDVPPRELYKRWSELTS